MMFWVYGTIAIPVPAPHVRMTQSAGVESESQSNRGDGSDRISWSDRPYRSSSFQAPSVPFHSTGEPERDEIETPVQFPI